MTQKFLQFQLENGEQSLLDAAIAPEIRLVVAQDIVPVPELPAWVLGIYQWRGEMLWLVDLCNLLGFASLSWQDKNYAIVVRVEERSLGLVVPVVNGIGEHDLQLLQAPSEELFSPRLLPFVQGFFLGAEQKILTLLKAEAILRFCSQKSPQ